MATERLDDLDQAAMLLLSMGEEAAAQVLSYLDRPNVEAIVHKMAQLSAIKQSDADDALDSFFRRYQQQAGISPASRAYLKKTLDMALGDKVARGLINSIYGDEINTLVKKLEWLDTKILAKEIENEHIQIQAALLSLLEPLMAANIIAYLPASMHDEIIIRIAKIKELDSQIMMPLQQLIERCMTHAQEFSNTEIEGLKQVADIVNNYQGNKEQLLQMIRLNNKELADEIADNMYDFGMLEKQSAECLQKIFNELDVSTVGLALKGIDEQFKQLILSSLPSRMAEGISDQIELLGAVTMSKVTQARKTVMSQVKEMNANGDISLKLFEEQVVE